MDAGLCTICCLTVFTLFMQMVELLDGYNDISFWVFLFFNCSGIVTINSDLFLIQQPNLISWVSHPGLTAKLDSEIVK